MRAFFAAIPFLLVSLYTPALAYGPGGADSIYVPGTGYVERWQVSGLPQSKFGTFTKKPKTKQVTIAGKTFNPTPGGWSWHSDSAPWVAELQALRGKTARQIGLSRTTLWCGTVLGEATSLPKPKINYHWAANWRGIGRPIGAPRVGAIALVSYGRRGRGGIDHVAVVSRFDGRGRPVLISGNSGGTVREHAAHGVVAWIWPGA